MRAQGRLHFVAGLVGIALRVAGACSVASSCGSDDAAGPEVDAATTDTAPTDAVTTDAVTTDTAPTDAVTTDAVTTDTVATDTASEDGAGEVTATVCDLVTSEGCPPDTKCTLGSGGRVCGPFGAGLEGAGCQGSGDAACARGFACISVSGGENGAQICRRFCAGDGDCVGPSSLCLQLDPSVAPLFCTNVARCDPFGDQCESGRACYPALYNDGSLVCLDNGSVADGEACGHLSACKKGSVCVRPDASAQGVCRELCGGAAPCSAGDCQMFPTSTVGYCP
jgi:hypothetical protein